MEATISILGVGAVIAAAAMLIGERRHVAAIERRMAELEVAQNLLDDLRRGGGVLPSSWRLQRHPLGDDLESVTITGPEGTTLSTVRRVPR